MARLSDEIKAGIAEYNLDVSYVRRLLDKADYEFLLMEDIADGVVVDQAAIVVRLNAAFGGVVEVIPGTKCLFYCGRYVYIVQQAGDILKGRRTYLPYTGFSPVASVVEEAKASVTGIIRAIRGNADLIACYTRELGDEVEDLYFGMAALKADSVIDSAGRPEFPKRFLPLFGMFESMPANVQLEVIALAYNYVCDQPIVGSLQKHGSRELYTDARGYVYLIGYDNEWFTVTQRGRRGAPAREFLSAIQAMWPYMADDGLVSMVEDLCDVRNLFRAECARLGEDEVRVNDVITAPALDNLNWRVPRARKQCFYQAIATAFLGEGTAPTANGLKYVHVANRWSLEFEGVRGAQFKIVIRRHNINPNAFNQHWDNADSADDTDESGRSGSVISDGLPTPVSRESSAASLSRRSSSSVAALSRESSRRSERWTSAIYSEPVPTQLTHTLARLLTLFE